MTGEITIAQRPNWPLIGALIALAARVVADRGSTLDDIGAVAFTLLMLIWASDELVRGVNPWRRLLGAVVIVWQLVELVA